MWESKATAFGTIKEAKLQGKANMFLAKGANIRIIKVEKPWGALARPSVRPDLEE